MLDASSYERPNTVSGLVAKHAELSALRDKYKTEIKNLDEDMRHLASVIRLFDPSLSVYPLRGTVTKRRIKRGALKRFILNTLREEVEPLTSRDLTMRWGENQGLEVSDETYPELRRKVSSSLKECVKQGLIEDRGRVTDPDHCGSYKLWALKKGGQ
jgi:hypothetical protein